jgi:hypothetical protein
MRKIGTEFILGKNELNLPPNKVVMKHILCALMVITSPVLWAQSLTADAIVYAENGEKFHLYLNGELMNEDPKTNIKLRGLTSEFYQARVDFVDSSLPDFTNNNFAVKYGIEVTYRVKLAKNGYVLRYFSERPVDAQYKLDSETVVYHEGGQDEVAVEPAPVAEPTPNQNLNINMNVNENGANTQVNAGSTQKTTTTVTTTTNGKPKAKSETVGINMNVDGMNMGINMTIPTDGMEVEESHTTTTTTTTTTTSGNWDGGNTRPAPKPQSQPQAQPAAQVNCGIAMNSTSFAQAKSSIASKSFSDSKMTTAKQITQTNCLTAQQIKEITELFDFDEDRVTYASYAHKRCVDPQNYFIINDAFQFESSIDELNQNITK